MAAARVNPGDVLAGKYRVERVLGEGGMGIVVAAFHLALEQRVAVKFLRKDVAERGDAAERFRREARAVAKIRSEHVARVLDVGTMEDGDTYIVMEYLDGNDLAAEMHRRGSLPVPEAVDIALQIADAVHEAHLANIVHRDLKPANVFLVSRSDGSRLAKVLDFGISKSLIVDSASNVSLTQTSTVMGSPLYMSPEQMRSARDVDARTDVWALGAILYEALSGSPPHVGTSLPEICTSLLHDTPRPLDSSRSDIPPGLAEVVMRCLAKDRSDRWPTMRDFIMALLPFAPESSVIVTAATGLPVYRPSTGSGMARYTGPPRSPSAVSLPTAVSGPQPKEPSVTNAPASLTLNSGADVREARRARTAIFVGLAGAAILVSSIIFVLFRYSGAGDDAAKAPPRDGIVRADPPKAAAPVVAPVAVAAAAADPGPAVTAAAQPAPTQEAAAAPSAAESAGSTKHTKPPRVGDHTVPKRPPGSTEAITDFGGRR